MPKKTRKQKLLAKERHQSHVTSASHTETQAALQVPGMTYSLHKHIPTNSAPQGGHTVQVDTTLAVIKADLVKTLILAGLACSFLILLSFVWH